MIDRTRQLLNWLRIAWTAFCGLLCVLLLVLWVRSYDQGQYQCENPSVQGHNDILIEVPV